MKHKTYHESLRSKMDEYVHFVFSLAKNFPKEETYNVTSQLKRATLSIVLNYIEGYARGRDKVHRSFLGISYGSLKESAYLIDFSHKEGYMTLENKEKASKAADEIGVMLWSTIEGIKAAS